MFVLRDCYTVLFWNRYLESWTGIPREEIVGRHIGTYFPDLATGPCQLHLHDVFEQGLPRTFSTDEHRHLIPAPLPSGQLRIEYTTVTPIPREDGEAWDALVAIQDVTDFSRALRDSQIVRNQALDELERHQRAEERLREEEELFRTVAHKAPVMMWMADREASCTFFNSVWLEFTGRSLEEAMGQGWAEGVHPDDLTHCLATYFGAFDERRDFEMEFRTLRHDREYRWVLNQGTPLYAESGEFAGFICSCLDITDRKRAEEELRSAKNAAETATLEKSQFLANMSHEIRTPMTAVLGFTELLLDDQHGISEPEERADAMVTIKRNGTYLMELLNDILDLSKIEAGRLSLERMRVSPIELLADVRHLMGVRAQSQGLRFQVELGSEIPETIESDPTRLRQIIVNLVANAIKFTRQGGITIRLRLAGSPDLPRLQFEIEDTGIGMSDEQLREVFEPFTQADSSTTRKYGGTGLGLTIATRLTELLAGTLQASSRVGRGSTFRVSVPTGSLEGVPLIDPAEWSLDATPDEPDSTTRANRLHCRVLVAEDGIDNQRLIRAILAPRVDHVVVAENGQVALELAMNAEIDGRAFDVILMDMQMPVLDGYEATKRLRMNGYERPIIALTAHAMAGDRERCLKAGCDDFATKPIDRRELLRKISRIVEKSEDIPGA